MYVDPFVAGVFVTISFEMVVLILLAIFRRRK